VRLYSRGSSSNWLTLKTLIPDASYGWKSFISLPFVKNKGSLRRIRKPSIYFACSKKPPLKGIDMLRDDQLSNSASEPQRSTDFGSQGRISAWPATSAQDLESSHSPWNQTSSYDCPKPRNVLVVIIEMQNHNSIQHSPAVNTFLQLLCTKHKRLRPSILSKLKIRLSLYLFFFGFVTLLQWLLALVHQRYCQWVGSWLSSFNGMSWSSYLRQRMLQGWKLYLRHK